ncbi:hypothetical protein [Antrihabitans stalactiti]|uniref:Uncharacterized protein n=1 Tax=Antrihabitans stalactiti TaxID=2584121 RepID=A0A848KN92_9NOCA|nr:hypothetical protein [Antrihabitans stalactiti]NMN97177.1 hypothetical protein [Antrihabitans stalactiti]
MYESVFELVDRFAAALPKSTALAEPVASIVQQLTRKVERVGRTLRRLEGNSIPDVREIFGRLSAELKATKAELLHWQVVLARLTGSGLPIDPNPVPKGVWVVTPPQDLEK